MAVAYTNRKGQTYYLGQGTTKTGKVRYYFSREQQGTLVREVPTGKTKVFIELSLDKKIPHDLRRGGKVGWWRKSNNRKVTSFGTNYPINCNLCSGDGLAPFWTIF